MVLILSNPIVCHVSEAEAFSKLFCKQRIRSVASVYSGFFSATIIVCWKLVFNRIVRDF